MPAPNPQKRSVDFLKTKIMQPALTSHFECHFVIPQEVKKQLEYNNISADSPLTQESLTISCSEASLPGSSLATHELNNDFTGVTQRHAYRRLYDDRADFTFYVNREYLQIRLFEIWMRYISGEQLTFGERTDVSYRSPYPKQYKASALYISKFERDQGIKGGSRVMKYTFVNAFPISITSMPVSYDTSQLLKCTVSFTYDRYFVDNPKDRPPQGQPSQSPATGVPNPNDVSYSGGVVSNAFTGNASIANSNLINNISPNQYNVSSGTLSNSVGEGEELINAINANNSQVESGLPYVGRNIGPLAP